jgi:hypothetical protein
MQEWAAHLLGSPKRVHGGRLCHDKRRSLESLLGGGGGRYRWRDLSRQVPMWMRQRTEYVGIDGADTGVKMSYVGELGLGRVTKPYAWMEL